MKFSLMIHELKEELINLKILKFYKELLIFKAIQIIYKLLIKSQGRIFLKILIWLISKSCYYLNDSKPDVFRNKVS